MLDVTHNFSGFVVTLLAAFSLFRCSEPPLEATAWQAGTEESAVTIHSPDRLAGLNTEAVDDLGNPVSVMCGTCHEGRDQPMIRAADELTEFHTDLQFEHGDLVCASCHAPENRDHLQLSSGDQLLMNDVMNLCAQCHGPQTRDYEHGSHGGMNGYWDLTRGPRDRNNCIDCHDVHAPEFPTFLPAPGPQDRFMHH